MLCRYRTPLQPFPASRKRNHPLLPALIALAGLGAPEPASALDLVPKEYASFAAACKGKTIAPSPRQVEGQLVFNGSSGGQQLDPLVVVGGGAVINVSNTGIYMFTKAGEFVTGGNTGCLNLDFDPKTYFDPIGKRVVLASLSFAGSARISFAKTGDARGGWWAYTIPVPGWVDGGAVGGSRKWIAYSYPAQGGQKVFLLDREQAEAGAKVTVVELPAMPFPGQPVFTFDADQDRLYFVSLSGNSIQVNYIDAAGAYKTQKAVPHGFNLGYPIPFRQKSSGSTCSAGDINPKMAVLRNGSIWTCDAASTSVGGTNRSMVRFYQVDLTGKLIQSGSIDDPTGAIYSGQATLAVNMRNDMLLVFQQSGAAQFIGSRMSYRLGTDPLGTLRPVVKHAEGAGANQSTAAWGDYSGASIDGDNDLDMWGINSVASASGAGNSVIFRLGLSDGSALEPPHARVPGFSIRQGNGILALTGDGLDGKTTAELYGPSGVRWATGAFAGGGGAAGHLRIRTANFPKGPVFLRLNRPGARESGMWVNLVH